MEMIKAMIVEDDQIILNGLTTMIAWGNYGFSVAATAFNGKQGINRFLEHRPEVVFTDIRMPVMDGLDMLREIRKADEFARFIILSSFGEFDYAKQAIELRTSAYILKEELSPASLASILIQIRKDLEKQSAMAFNTIYDIVQSFIQGGDTPPDSAVARIGKLLSQHMDLQEEYGIDALLHKMDDAFRKVYQQQGKIAWYTPPDTSGSVPPLEWISDQLRMVYAWRGDSFKNLSHVISNAMFFIKENYAKKDLAIGEVAEHVWISEGRLSVLFRQETGKTMKEYITELRLEHAKDLLRQGQLRIYEIADRVGFTSAEYFTRVFTRTVGVPPQNYRKDEV